MPYSKSDEGSPNKNLNKGYGSESNSQEKSNLMNDNPVARDASGGRPMILKHMSGSRIGGSPLMQKGTKPDIIDADGDGDKKELMVDALKQAKSKK